MSHILKYVDKSVLAHVGMDDDPATIYQDDGWVYSVYIGDCALTEKRIIAIQRNVDRAGERERNEWFADSMHLPRDKGPGISHPEFNQIHGQVVKRKNRTAGRDLSKRLMELATTDK